MTLETEEQCEAWRFIERLYPGNLLYLRLLGDYAREGANAIDDLGADSPDRRFTEVWTYSRDPRVRDAVLRRADGTMRILRGARFP